MTLLLMQLPNKSNGFFLLARRRGPHDECSLSRDESSCLSRRNFLFGTLRFTGRLCDGALHASQLTCQPAYSLIQQRTLCTKALVAE
jgi:hypothetical protein